MSTTERAQSDLKKLKSKYNSHLSTLKILFTEWTDDDLLFTLKDADGDLELAIDRISEGHASQWDEVKTKKSKKEAAAANKATIEITAPSATPSALTYPSYSNCTSRQSKPSKPRIAAAAATAAPSNRSAHHLKYQAVAWQSSKKLDFDGWNAPQQKIDDGNGWNSVENSTPKRLFSTPSSSTKTSNSGGGGAKTWASLLQSKEEPESVKGSTTTDSNTTSEKELLSLQKVDDAWLSGPTSTTDSSNQWDQPIQETIKPSLSSSSSSSSPPKPQQPHFKKSVEDDIPIDFNTLSLKEQDNVPQINSNHPGVADLLNSVKHQDEAPPSQPQQQQIAQTHQPPQSQQHNYHNHQATEQQMYQQMYQQQQQQQQHHQYQQFGIQSYNNNNSINAGFSMYGNGANTSNSNAADSFFLSSSGLFNHQHHQDNDLNVQNSKTATTSTAAAVNGGIPEANDMYQQQSQQYNNMQSFYPYYYMQNQFNAYSSSSYGQPSQSQRYDQPGVANSTKPISSSYGGTSSVYSNQLYGFDDFGLGNTATTTSSEASRKSATSSTAATSSVQQPYANYFNAHSPMFSSYGQQNSNSGNQQYWNQ